MMRILGVILVMLAGVAGAQEGPSFDCGEAGRTAEEMICADAGLAALDRRVAGRYAAALEAAGGEAAELRAYQRGWIKGRDECWKAEDQRACVEGEYLRREAELVARWMLEAPTGTAVWACGGNPANEVVTMFFDTELPSLRFERGDSVDTGVQVMAASGAKYEGSFGRSIWMKGDRATYREPDPDGTSYECELVEER
ncbi:MliC family protein [Roseovarius sp.]|uniref:MliC family protein n=1 Tax=Roseovarius sp. TaxID=1486281 RepID=UPI002635B3AB|nr:MliC family protein [Roseovarius sp.]MDM8166129.1 MliC family protein [Roseovarius sp.]